MGSFGGSKWNLSRPNTFQQMNSPTETQEQLAALSAHLGARRPAILEAWRAVVDNDPDLTTGSSLSRTQFNDHIPDIWIVRASAPGLA
jgi:hypothetical protein